MQHSRSRSHAHQQVLANQVAQLLPLLLAAVLVTRWALVLHSHPELVHLRCAPKSAQANVLSRGRETGYRSAHLREVLKDEVDGVLAQRGEDERTKSERSERHK
jgi:hypothetical protein